MADKKTPVVLVADDEPSMLALVSAFVRSKGYTVVEASDGDMAWQLACDRLPDLIILDVMMPGMSGWEVCRKIREAVSLAHTGVIMLTGIGESLNEMTSPLYGADAHVDKPFDLADLERTIVETLKKRHGGAMGRSDLSAPVDDRATVRSPGLDTPVVPSDSTKSVKAKPKAAAKKGAAPTKKAGKASKGRSPKARSTKKAAKKPVRAAARKAQVKKIKAASNKSQVRKKNPGKKPGKARVAKKR